MKALLISLLLLGSPAQAATTRYVAQNCSGIPSPCYTGFSLGTNLQASDANDDSIIVVAGYTYLRDWYNINVSNLKIVFLDASWRNPNDPNWVQSQESVIDGGKTEEPSFAQGIWRTSNSPSAINRLEINGGEFKNAYNTTANGVPFRIQVGMTGLGWIHHVYCHDNQMNFEGAPESLKIENSEFYHCYVDSPLCEGNQHNLYVNQRQTGAAGTGCNIVWFQYNKSWAPSTGHCFKTRANNNYIMYNRLLDGNINDTNIKVCPPSTSYRHPSYNIDMPEHGLAFVIGNIIEQKAGNIDPAGGIENTTMLAYGSENQNNTNHHLYVIGNTFVNLFVGGGIFMNTVNANSDTQITFKDNIFYGDTTSVHNGPGTYTASNNYYETGLNNGVKFLNAPTGDYHLTTATPSTILNAGIDPGTNDGFNCLPNTMYVYDKGNVTRTTSGSAIDIGAFEFPQTGGTPDACTPF